MGAGASVSTKRLPEHARQTPHILGPGQDDGKTPTPIAELFRRWVCSSLDNGMRGDQVLTLTRSTFCTRVNDLIETSDEDIVRVFDHLDVGNTGSLDVDQFTRWLLSELNLESMLADCYCADDHQLSIFVPKTDGWCCEECGLDFEVGTTAMQCSECDRISWCFDCIFEVGKLPHAQTFVSSAFRTVLATFSSEEVTSQGADEAQAPEVSAALQGVGDHDIDDAERTVDLDMGPVRLHVCSLAGTICDIDALGSWTGRDLKRAIEKVTEILDTAQSLVFGVRALQDDDVLAAFRMGKDADVVLVRRNQEQAEWLKKVRDAPVHGGHVTFLQGASHEVCTDELLVLEAVSRCGGDLRYASAELRANPKVALAAWNTDGDLARQYIAPELFEDADFARMAVGFDGHRLQCFGLEVRETKEVVLAALHQNGNALTSFPPGSVLLEDTDILEVALVGGFRLRRSRQLNCVAPVVLATVRRHPEDCQYIAPALRADPLFGLRLVSIDGNFLNFLSQASSTPDVFSVAIENGFQLRLARKDLRGSWDLVCKVVAKRGLDLQFASERLRTDRRVVMIAVEQCGTALKFAGVLLRNERKIVEKAIQQNREAYQFRGSTFKNDTDLISSWVKGKSR